MGEIPKKSQIINQELTELRENLLKGIIEENLCFFVKYCYWSSGQLRFQGRKQERACCCRSQSFASSKQSDAWPIARCVCIIAAGEGKLPI